jgi:hypothetical protein
MNGGDFNQVRVSARYDEGRNGNEAKHSMENDE